MTNVIQLLAAKSINFVESIASELVQQGIAIATANAIAEAAAQDYLALHEQYVNLPPKTTRLPGPLTSEQIAAIAAADLENKNELLIMVQMHMISAELRRHGFDSIVSL